MLAIPCELKQISLSLPLPSFSPPGAPPPRSPPEERRNMENIGRKCIRTCKVLSSFGCHCFLTAPLYPAKRSSASGPNGLAGASGSVHWGGKSPRRT